MHLRSITLKGFKSFPDRTKLDFAPGVSVVVGPNGSGKSNITDAVLWAMGEQSPLAVRGQSMRDVIFGGGRGVKARSSAEVEIVIDNGDGAVDLPLGEISILRRLDRSGEGEYRLNGARCRLVDVLEVLSDTGLGKEMHSVVSQGRVESIVTSKPRDRRLLIEEAAGLGKHRKRRRRAQLKLERTQDNLDRALDVEREARSRLRPLKRQAEAAELHARLERQTLEARWELVRDLARARSTELRAAEAVASSARAAREEAQTALAAVAGRRRAAEQAMARRSEQREAFAQRVYRARSAGERVELRLERVRATAEDLTDRAEGRSHELTALAALAESEGEAADAQAGAQRVEALEAELEQLAADHATQLEIEVAALEQSRRQAVAAAAEGQEAVAAARALLASATAAAETARARRRERDRALEAARRESARVGAELAACNQFLRTRSAAAARGGSGARTLADELEVTPGYERAVAAAFGGLLRSSLAERVRDGSELLDAAGADGGRVLIIDSVAPGPAPALNPPAAGARHLAQFVSGEARVLAVAQRLLSNTWVVEEIEQLPPGFAGVAVTRAGRVWHGRHREMRRAPEGGEERVLAERNRREELIAASEAAVRAEHAAKLAGEPAEAAVAAADATREQADRALREASQALAAATEDARRDRLADRAAPRRAAGGRVGDAPRADRGRARRRAPGHPARRARALRARPADRATARPDRRRSRARTAGAAPRRSARAGRGGDRRARARAGDRAGRRPCRGRRARCPAAQLRLRGGADPGDPARPRRRRHARRGARPAGA